MSEITVKQLVRIAEAIHPEASEPVSETPRFCIVVLDRGFVYIGHATITDSWCVIRDAKNIRQWGTDEKRPGLGWIAANGPTEKSKVDAVGTVRAPMRAVIALIDAEESKWNTR